jgi:YD repeat-containing protein
VARITGTTLSQVTAIVSQATLDATCTPGNDAAVRTLLQTLRSQLSGALVSIYTYLPGVGMTSETDPRGRVTYYQYDSFERLLSITDNDGNIIKTFNYQYEHP